jgi:uncharacterized membrane protein YfcA
VQAVGIDTAMWVALGLCAFCTSMLTAVLGLGGGIILISVMLLFLDPLVAIPLHAAIQLMANASRTVIQREHVAWPLLWRYAWPLIPAGMIGLRVAQWLPPQALSAAIGLFVLGATWLPDGLSARLGSMNFPPERRFTVMGCVIGLLNPIVGVTGPLQAPFFLQLGLSRQGVVGTFAACQTLSHLVKLLLFGFAGFLFAPHVGALLALGGVVILGTWLGSQWLEVLDERVFLWIYRGVLTAVSVRLVLVEGFAPLLAALENHW